MIFNMKSFLDFMMHSESQKNIVLELLKCTKVNFQMFAAKVNNIPFKRLMI